MGLGYVDPQGQGGESTQGRVTGSAKAAVYGVVYGKPGRAGQPRYDGTIACPQWQGRRSHGERVVGRGRLRVGSSDGGREAAGGVVGGSGPDDQSAAAEELGAGKKV